MYVKHRLVANSVPSLAEQLGIPRELASLRVRIWARFYTISSITSSEVGWWGAQGNSRLNW